MGHHETRGSGPPRRDLTVTAVPPGGGASGDDSASPASAEAIEAGRRLFAQPCIFVTGAAALAALPAATLPEIAFAGRSNVGKSSLVNALTGRRTLARTSRTPGRTRQINFFNLGGRLMLVDLPGYGYARAPKSEIARWTQVLESYLRGRPVLRRLCLLVDARHGLKPGDETLMAMLDGAAVSYLVVLTKADKVTAEARAATLSGLEAALVAHPAALPHALTTSARTGRGVAEMRAHLAALAVPG